MNNKTYKKGKYNVSVNYIDNLDIHTALKDSLDDSIIQELMKEERTL